MTAYNVIKKYGWTQGYYGNKEKGFCLLGALYEAYPNYELRLKAREKLAKQVHTRFFAKWNDAKSRTAEQVLTMLKACRV